MAISKREKILLTYIRFIVVFLRDLLSSEERLREFSLEFMWKIDNLHTGMITLDDMAWAVGPTDTRFDEGLVREFAQLDKNGDGVIDKQEMHEYVSVVLRKIQRVLANKGNALLQGRDRFKQDSM